MDSDVKQIISLMFTTGRLIKECGEGIANMSPYSHLQLETLRYVSEEKIPAMKKVANYLCITPPSATSLINGLVKSGQLSRTTDEKDRRMVRLSITPKGQKNLDDGLKEIHENMAKIFSHLDTSERKNLIDILSKLSSIFKQ
ncbi:MAG: MarR family transcriptional regulator [Candidatus Gracilibacteria bacterium]